jgi:hypothetical protein
MTEIAVIVFAILPALAFGFVLGRIWQMRIGELDRRASFAMPTVARIPLPTGAQTSEQAPASPERRSTVNNRLDHRAHPIYSRNHHDVALARREAAGGQWDHISF